MNMRMNPIWTLAVGTFAILMPPAKAGAILPAGFTAGIEYYNGTSTVPILYQLTPFVLASSASQASISGCLIATASQSACGTGRAAMGNLGARSSLTDLNPSTIPGGSEDANASSIFWDVLTVTGPSMAGGQTYTMVPTVTIHGTGSWNNVALPQTVGLGIEEFGPDGTSVLETLYPDATQSSYSMTFTLDGIPFQPGVQFNFALGFGEAARIYTGPAAAENTQVSANFLSTMLLTGITVLDSQGRAVPNFTIQSESGTVYGENGVVPEPASAALLALGVLAIGVFRVRRSAARRLRVNP